MKGEGAEGASDANADALRDFGKEAAGALAAFRAVTADIEQRLLARVEARAVEQSRVMQGYESHCAGLLANQEADETAMDGLAARVDDLNSRLGDVLDATHVARSEASAATAACRRMEDEAGYRFGKKLDALASQVVGLAGMGERLTAIEAKIEKCATSVAAINELQRAQLRDVDDLRRALDAAIEAKIEKCLDSVAEFGVMVVAINENQRAQQREIDRLSDAGETANSEPPAGKGT